MSISLYIDSMYPHSGDEMRTQLGMCFQ